jgi:hypothetical protein
MRALVTVAVLVAAPAALACVGAGIPGPSLPPISDGLVAVVTPTNALFALADDFIQVGDTAVVRDLNDVVVATVPLGNDINTYERVLAASTTLPSDARLTVTFEARFWEEFDHLDLPALETYEIQTGLGPDTVEPLMLGGVPRGVVEDKPEPYSSCDMRGTGRRVFVDEVPDAFDSESSIGGWILYRVADGERTLIGSSLAPRGPVEGIYPAEGENGRIEIVAFDLAGNESRPRDVELSGFGVEEIEEDVNPVELDDEREDLVRISSGCSSGPAEGPLALVFALALLSCRSRRPCRRSRRCS